MILRSETSSSLKLTGDVTAFIQEAVAAPAPVVKKVWLSADNPKSLGLQVSAAFSRKGNVPTIEFEFENTKPADVSGFQIQFNKNSYRLSPAAPLRVPEPVKNGQKVQCTLELATKGRSILRARVKNALAIHSMAACFAGPLAPAFNPALQMAVKFSGGVVYFQDVFPAQLLLDESGPMEAGTFISTWQGIPDASEVHSKIEGIVQAAPGDIKSVLAKQRISLVAERQVEDVVAMYFSGKFIDGEYALVEIRQAPGAKVVDVALRSKADTLRLNGLVRTLEDALRK